MDIEEFVYRKKRENPKYSYSVMAKDLQVTTQYLRMIRKHQTVPAVRFLLELETYTQGKIDCWELARQSYKIIKERV